MMEKREKETRSVRGPEVETKKTGEKSRKTTQKKYSNEKLHVYDH